MNVPSHPPSRSDRRTVQKNPYSEDTVTAHGGQGFRSPLATTLCRWLVAGGVATLATLVLLVRGPLVYDEPAYMENVPLVARMGIGADFLRHMVGQAGPLFGIVHFAFSPITHLQPPGVRLLNVALFVAICLIIAWAFVSRGAADPLTSAGSLIGIPMMWVLAGLALTEIPAMFFIAIAWALLVPAFADRRGRMTAAVLGSLAGLAMALAILGRQTFLVVLLAVGFLYRSRRDIAPLVAFLLAASLPPAYVFHVWGALAPPDSGTASGIVLAHGALALAYAGVAMLLLAPQFFRYAPRLWIAVTIAASIACAIDPALVVTPMRSVVVAALPERLVGAFSYTASALLVGFGAVFGWSVLYAVWTRRDDRWFVASGFALLLVLGTTVGITHQFSSRYVATAAPFLVVVAQPYMFATANRALGLLAGMSVGAASLISYLRLPG